MAKKPMPHKNGSKVTRNMAEDYFCTISSKQTPLVNALFSPMGFKLLVDGRPQLCPTTSPCFNHRPQNPWKTMQILKTVEGFPGYDLKSPYNFGHYIARQGKEDDVPVLVDYSDVDGPSIVGKPVAQPLRRRQAEPLLDILDRNESLTWLLDHVMEHIPTDEKTDEKTMRSSLTASASFVCSKLAVDHFLAKASSSNDDFTSTLHSLQILLKRESPHMALFFPHVPVERTSEGVEELPLVFHQTRFLLQSLSTIRNGTLEGFHRMHAAVSSLTNYPYRGVNGRSFPLDGTPKFLNTRLFFDRAECSEAVPFYQNPEPKEHLRYGQQVRNKHLAKTSIHCVQSAKYTSKICAHVVRGVHIQKTWRQNNLRTGCSRILHNDSHFCPLNYLSPSPESCSVISSIQNTWRENNLRTGCPRILHNNLHLCPLDYLSPSP
jgi:hypothetical protein